MGLAFYRVNKIAGEANNTTNTPGAKTNVSESMCSVCMAISSSDAPFTCWNVTRIDMAAPTTNISRATMSVARYLSPLAQSVILESLSLNHTPSHNPSTQIAVTIEIGRAHV